MLDIKINVYPVRVDGSEQIAYLGRYVITGEGIDTIDGAVGNLEPKGAMLAALVEASAWLNKNVNVRIPPYDLNTIAVMKGGVIHGANTQEGASDADVHHEPIGN